MSGTDIFISYARADRPVARMFAEAFADEGFNVWWDASLHSGETFDEVIEQKLRDAHAVVVLWSPRSVASRWVRAEATQADRRNKLVPAIIEPCDRPIIFELTHAADLCEWTGDITDFRWQDFANDLRRLIKSRIEQENHTAQNGASPRTAAPGSVAAPQRPPAPDRRPLRPGNDEVILARATRERAGRPARLAEVPPPEPADADAHAEVHCLELEGEELGENVFVVDSSSMKIGRTAPAHIVLSHKSVSREHCVIGLANDELLVTDLNSTNGTYVDGERISRATILPVGSVLRLGQISMRHSIRPPADSFETDSGHTGRIAANS